MTNETISLVFYAFFMNRELPVGRIHELLYQIHVCATEEHASYFKLPSALQTGIVRSNASTLIGFLTSFKLFPLKKLRLKEIKKSSPYTGVVFRYFRFRENDWNSDYFGTQQFHEGSKIQQTEIRD
jgi:hypothetical protein